jgi:hypothetical protein
LFEVAGCGRSRSVDVESTVVSAEACGASSLGDVELGCVGVAKAMSTDGGPGMAGCDVVSTDAGLM